MMDNKNIRVSVVGNTGAGRCGFVNALESLSTMIILNPEEIKIHETRAEIITILTNCCICSRTNAENILENKTLDELESIKYKLLEGSAKIINNEMVYVDPIDTLQNYSLDDFIEYEPKKENKKSWKKNKFWER